MKELLALGATVLIVVAYVPYTQDILKGKTKPHVYSWSVSALVTFIVFGLQLSQGAGWGLLPTFIAGIAGLLIFMLSLKQQKRASITKSDTLFFILSLVAVALWLVVDRPLLSVIIVSLVDILAFIPTFRKSWNRPDQETVSAYAINSIRFVLATLAIRNYTLVTILSPLSQAIADGVLTLFLILRRRVVFYRD